MISSLAFSRPNQVAGELSRHPILLAVVYALSAFQGPALAQDQGWPRSLEDNGNEVVIFQPQIEDWEDHKIVKARAAIGFGMGRSKVRTRGLVYQGTPSNERLVGEFETVAKSSIKPGIQE